ncbi:MAG: hydroxymyristoyl-ACP dehydratase [Bacteroidales bacterium]|nr:hydroxymyristoyl-ACP dehydratase [Bacteroidales bacterium]
MYDYPIEELIPQRSPFIMVDKLLHFEEKTFSSSFTIKSDNLFSKNGFFQEEGMIENIAQTAAAGAGYSFKVKNEEVKLGYIGALKNVKIFKQPPVGSTINTKITIVTKVLNVDIVEGKIYDINHQLMASCEMKIFIGE